MLHMFFISTFVLTIDETPTNRSPRACLVFKCFYSGSYFILKQTINPFVVFLTLSGKNGNRIIKRFKAADNAVPDQVGHDVQERLLIYAG
jgi:hypothetical protein